MDLYTWSWLFLVLYVSAMIGFGYLGSRRVTGADDFATARRGYGPLLLALAFASSAASGATFLGLPGLTYRLGTIGRMNGLLVDISPSTRLPPPCHGRRDEGIKLPGVLVRLTERTDYLPGDGSVVDHVAFRVPSLAGIETAGLTVQRLEQFPGVGYVTSPAGERIELFEDAATNLTFTPDSGPLDALGLRHGRPVPPPIAFHHIHLYVPAPAVADATAWYVRVFGGTPGKRSTYDAVDLPGVNINISAAPKPVAGMNGPALRRIGFEVESLDAFRRRLQGLSLEDPGTNLTTGTMYTSGAIVDPWGTRIEITEGLRRY